MGKHREISTRKKVGPYLSAGVALPLASLFGFVNAVDSGAPLVRLLAATSIFIDGTKDILPTDDSQAADRMRGALGGAFDQCDGADPCANNVHIAYSRDFGILTGGAPYDESKAEATALTIQAIRDAQTQNPGDPVYVVGYSQGANASSDVIKRAEELNSNNDPSDDIDLSNVTFVMLGNGARNDGGLWARMPAGVHVPLLGLSFGASTNPSTDPNAPDVILISKQYDGASDVPKYVLNPLAVANAAMGFMYVHNGYYAEEEIPELKDGLTEEEITALKANPKYIVTTNGNVTDIVIRNEVGQLPLTQPLLAMGVPPEVVKAMDPLLRAMIEAGYDRPPNGGEYSSEPVHFGLMPGPSQWVTDFKSLADAMEETEDNLDDLNQANLIQSTSTPPEPDLEPFNARTADLTIERDTQEGDGTEVSTFQEYLPPQSEELPPPPPEELPPPADPEQTEEPETESVSTSRKPLLLNDIRGPIGGSPAPRAGINGVHTAINGVVTGTVNAITGVLGVKPPSSGGSTTGTTAPDPSGTPDPGSAGGTDTDSGTP